MTIAEKLVGMPNLTHEQAKGSMINYFRAHNPEFFDVFRFLSRAHTYSWLIGGAVYRAIAAEIYGATPKKPLKLDILAANIQKAAQAFPRHWGVCSTTGHELTLVHGQTIAQIQPIFSSVHGSSNTRDIGGYLQSVPLNVMALTYDLKGLKLIGTGLAAIRDRTVLINNLGSACYSARRRGMTLKQYLEEKANELDFVANAPSDEEERAYREGLRMQARFRGPGFV